MSRPSGSGDSGDVTKVASEGLVRIGDLDAARRRIATLLSEHHLAEAVTRRVADEADLQLHRYRLVLDAVGVGLALFNETGLCLFLNMAAATRLGVDRAFAGRFIGELDRTTVGQSGLIDHFRTVVSDGVCMQWTFIDPLPQPHAWEARLTQLGDGPRGPVVLLAFEPAGVVGAASAADDVAAALLAHLSPRERDVLDLVAAGCTSQDIAAKLHRSPKTVQLHRYHIARKFGTSSVARWMRILMDADVLKDAT